MKLKLVFVLVALALLLIPVAASATIFWSDYFEDGDLDEYNENIGVVASQDQSYGGSWSAKADNEIAEDQWGSSNIKVFISYANKNSSSVRWLMQDGFEGRVGTVVYQCKWRASVSGYRIFQYPVEIVVRKIGGENIAYVVVKDFDGDIVTVAGPITITDEYWYQIGVGAEGYSYNFVYFAGEYYYPTVKAYATNHVCNWNGQNTQIALGSDALENSALQAAYFDNLLAGDEWNPPQ